MGAGEIEVGSLVAYLSYLVLILMSVVMATFMVSMIHDAAVSADRIQEVLDTDPEQWCRRPSPSATSNGEATSSSVTSASTTRPPSIPC